MLAPAIDTDILHNAGCVLAEMQFPAAHRTGYNCLFFPYQYAMPLQPRRCAGASLDQSLKSRPIIGKTTD